MTIQTYLGDEAARRRYWVGGHLGWRAFARAAPNPGHRALAEMESRGVVSGVITQNVDGLHLRAGSSHVIEVHGTMRRVLCLHCGQVFDRRDIAVQIEERNPWITVPENVALAPDGDVLPESTEGFVVPTCTVCAGMLKPDVVFFGDGEYLARPCHRLGVRRIRRPDDRDLTRMDACRRAEPRRRRILRLPLQPRGIADVDVHRVDRRLAVRTGLQEHPGTGVARDVAVAALCIAGRGAAEGGHQILRAPHQSGDRRVRGDVGRRMDPARRLAQREQNEARVEGVQALRALGLRHHHGPER
ncbi:unnamed protein product [Penicillium discolor]